MNYFYKKEFLSDLNRNLCHIYKMKGPNVSLPSCQHSAKRMNKGIILGLVVIVLVLSCKKDSRQELFTISYPPPPINFEILPGLNTIDTHIYTISPIPSRYKETLAASGRSENDVVAIEAKAALLASIFQDINLDFIHRVSVFIFDPFEPSNEIEFFYMDPVPFRDKTVIQLFPGIADISEWIENDFFGLEIRLDFRQNSPTSFPMEFEFDLRVMGK